MANEMVTVNGNQAILINYNMNTSKAVVRYVSTAITTEVAMADVIVNWKN